MNDAFTPHNELEHSLVAAQEGRLSEEAFMAELLNAQVFMPVYDKAQIGGFQDSKAAQPLTLKAETGEEVVVLFTSPERAKPFLEEFPAYRGGLLAELTWVLERLGSGIGITLNPGSEVGLDLEAEAVQHLSQQAAHPPG